MKKSLVLGTGLCVALMLSSCGSKESKYRQAYEHAKNNSTVTVQPEQTVVQTPVVTPMTTTTTTTNTVVATDNTPVRTEDLQVIDGSPLKAYSVVIGSFGVKTNAEGQARTLRNSGYDARIAFNSARNMYRVVATSFDNKADAVASRDQLRTKYPDAWLLFQK